MVEYLGCQFESKLSEDVIASKVLKKNKCQTKIPVSTKQVPIMQCANSAPLRLWIFIRFAVLKENLKIKFQKAQNNCIHFCLNLPVRSHIDPLHIDPSS